MSTEENKQLIQRWNEQAYEKKNLEVIDELHAPDYVGHIVGAPGPVLGRKALKRLFGAYFALSIFVSHRISSSQRTTRP